MGRRRRRSPHPPTDLLILQQQPEKQQQPQLEQNGGSTMGRGSGNKQSQREREPVPFQSIDIPVVTTSTAAATTGTTAGASSTITTNESGASSLLQLVPVSTTTTATGTLPSENPPAPTKTALVPRLPAPPPVLVEERSVRRPGRRARSTSPLKQRMGLLGGGGDRDAMKENARGQQQPQQRRGRSPLRFLRRKFSRSCSPEQHQQQRRSSIAGGLVEPIPAQTMQCLVEYPTQAQSQQSSSHHCKSNSHDGCTAVLDAVSPLTQPTFFSNHSSENSSGMQTNQAVLYDPATGCTARNHHHPADHNHHDPQPLVVVYPQQQQPQQPHQQQIQDENHYPHHLNQTFSSSSSRIMYLPSVPSRDSADAAPPSSNNNHKRRGSTSSSSRTHHPSAVGQFLTSARARFSRKFHPDRSTQQQPSTNRRSRLHHYQQQQPTTTTTNPLLELNTTYSAASTSIALLDDEISAAPSSVRGGFSTTSSYAHPPQAPPRTTNQSSSFGRSHDDDDEYDDEEHKEEITDVSIDTNRLLVVEDPSAMTESPHQFWTDDPPSFRTNSSKDDERLLPSRSSSSVLSKTEKKEDGSGGGGTGMGAAGIPTVLQVDVSRKRERRVGHQQQLLAGHPPSAANHHHHTREDPTAAGGGRSRHARTDSGTSSVSDLMVAPPSPDQDQDNGLQFQTSYPPSHPAGNSSHHHHTSALNTLVVLDENNNDDDDPTTAQTSMTTPFWNSVIFLLLLDPKSKFFELIRVLYPPATTTIGDLLAMIPKNATEPALAHQRYNGLIRPRSYARAWTDKKQLASHTSSTTTSNSSHPPCSTTMYRLNQNTNDHHHNNPSVAAGIEPGEILIAIPYEYATKYVCRLGRQILANQRIQSLLQHIEVEPSAAATMTTKPTVQHHAATKSHVPAEAPAVIASATTTTTQPSSSSNAAAAAAVVVDNRKKRRLSPGRSPASTPTRRVPSHAASHTPSASTGKTGVQDKLFGSLSSFLTSSSSNNKDSPGRRNQESALQQRQQMATLSSIASASAPRSSSIPSPMPSLTSTNAMSPPEENPASSTTPRNSSSSSAAVRAGTSSLEQLRRQLQQERQGLTKDDHEMDNSSQGRSSSSPLGPLVQQKIHQLEERFQNSSSSTSGEGDESLDTIQTATQVTATSGDGGCGGAEPKWTTSSNILIAPKTVKRENRSSQRDTNQHHQAFPLPPGRVLDFGNGAEGHGSSGNPNMNGVDRRWSNHPPSVHDREDDASSSMRSRRSYRSSDRHSHGTFYPTARHHDSTYETPGRFVDDNDDSQWSIDMSYSSWSRSVDSSLARRRRGLLEARASAAGGGGPQGFWQDPRTAAANGSGSASAYQYGRRLKQRKIIRKMRRYLAAGLILLIFLYTFDAGTDPRFTWSSWQPQASPPKTRSGPLGLFGLLQFGFTLVALIKFQLFLQQPPDAECRCPFIQGCAVYIENLRSSKRSRRG